jgi:Na+/H+ antiporter NhaD/arsenite permease-like protein
MNTPDTLAVLGHGSVDWGIAAVFATVYVGMFLGGLPKLKLDRTGVALLGAIAVIPLTGWTVTEAAQTVDLPTLVLLFAFMVVAAQMQLGGFFGAVTRGVGALPWSGPALLAALIAVTGGLSAVFSNDVVCLAVTPVVLQLCRQRGLPPAPFLIGLACASNIGSAATLIGNPQNMLIGSLLKLHFGDYLLRALGPVLLSLVLLWVWLAHGTGRAAWAERAPPTGSASEGPAFDTWQTAKGLSVAAALLVVFLFTDFPRELAALIGAGVLLLSRRLHSAEVMGFVDWSLLLLFIGLFVVNHAFQTTGLAAEAVVWGATQGLHLQDPGTLTVVAVLLSNLVSNVPAVMLLLPHLGSSPQEAGMLLALVSTLAGNLLLVGSIANLIVVDLAAKQGVAIDWRQHLHLAAPAALGSLAVTLLWLMMAT